MMGAKELRFRSRQLIIMIRDARRKANRHLICDAVMNRAEEKAVVSQFSKIETFLRQPLIVRKKC